MLEHVRTTPTVVFVDDVDWADAATVDLLRHLLFRLDDEQVPLLVLATSPRRSDRPRRRGRRPGSAREPRTAVVHLNPLTPLEATELAARNGEPGASARPGARPGRRERRQPAAGRGAGARRPRRLAACSGAAPAHPIVAAVGTTLDSLSPDAARVVLAAAVLGPDAQRRRVLALSEHERRRASTRPSTPVCSSRTARTLAFSHPVYAHTVYDRASSATRRDLHREVATILLEPRAVAHHLVAGDAVNDADALQARARRGQRRAGTRRVGRGGPLLRGRARARRRRPAELAELHRRAGLSRRGNLQLAQAVDHFEAALELLGDDADAETRTELHLWRIRCAIGTHEMLDVVRDRGPLEALVDEVEADAPELAAEALVELSQSYWVEWRMKQAHAVRRAGDGDRRRATTTTPRTPAPPPR